MNKGKKTYKEREEENLAKLEGMSAEEKKAYDKKTEALLGEVDSGIEGKIRGKFQRIGEIEGGVKGGGGGIVKGVPLGKEGKFVGKGEEEVKAVVSMQEHYGLMVAKGTPQLRVELEAYRRKLGPEKGGLGTYEHFKRAWKLLWPKFAWNQWTELIVCAWCDNDRVNVMGGSASGKTYTMAHVVLLDWLAAPAETMTSLTTVTADGLRLRMWGDLMRAFEAMPEEYKAWFKVYSSSNRMNITLADGGRDMDKYIIEGMATSKTADASGRIRGKHAPRRRVVLDEADDMPPVIYETFANIMSDPDVKIVDISNATDRYSLFCRASEPKDGWDSIDDSDLFWETKSGVCIHLDGLQNPNIKEPGSCPWMLDEKRVENIRIEFGESSKEWWSYVRGFPPPDGVIGKVWPSFAIERAKAVREWDFKPEMVASLDPAYEHDDCVLMIGEMGRTKEGKVCVQAVKSIKILAKDGVGMLPKDYQIKDAVINTCKQYGVKPMHFIMDKTGNGRSVWSKLVVEWSNEIIGIEYGGKATERSVRVGDPVRANEMFDRFVGELWFRARYAAEDGCLCGLGNVEGKTLDDLNGRRYERKETSAGSVIVIEKKDELKKRLGRSPDYGDAYCQFAELLVRLGHGPKVTSAAGKPVDRWRLSKEAAEKTYAIYDESKAYADSWNIL